MAEKLKWKTKFITNINQNPSQFCTAFVSNCIFEYGADIIKPKNYKYIIIIKYTINNKHINNLWSYSFIF